MSRDTFSTSFTCSRAGPRSLSSSTDAFITLKDRINFRFHESRFSSFHFLPLLLNYAINFSSPKNPKEGISKGTLASSSIFLRCKKKKKKNSNKSLESMLDTLWKRKTRSLLASLRRVWKREAKAIRLFLLTWNFFAKCRETTIFAEYQ